MVDDKYKIGNFINQLRKEKKLTQSELGEMIGVTNKAVSKWEVGENTPDSSLLPKIAKVLGVTVDELFRGERDVKYKFNKNPKIDYYNAVERLKRDSHFLFIILITYLLYIFIFLMIKPIKWTSEYENDVKILFDIFIPIFIYLVSSAIYVIIIIQDIIITELSMKKKCIYIILLILLFFAILFPLYFSRIVILRYKRKSYIEYIKYINI